MHSLLQDLTFSLRMIRKRPTASLVIVLTLGLGIGVNTTFFAAFYAMVLRPLPFEEPEQLVQLSTTRPALGERWDAVSAADLEDWRAENAVFDGMAAFTWNNFNVEFLDEPERIEGNRISADLFPLLGVHPLLGRHFEPEEDLPAGPAVALISHRLWQQRFEGDPNILGQSLRIDDEAHWIVGVMPKGFHFPNSGDLWTPLAVDAAAEPRERRRLSVIARMSDGVLLEQAKQAMVPIAQQLAEQYPESNRDRGIEVRDLRDSWLPPVTRLASIAQLVLVCGVLLIVCANVANLILAQATVRRQEMALRAALGAGREQLIRQALVEAMVLALCGGVLGALLASWGELWIQGISSVPIPYWLNFGMDRNILLYTLAITLLTGIIIGLLPALKSSGRYLFESLKSGGQAEDTSRGLARKGLVVAEYAVAVVVLVAGFLMVKSFDNVRRADRGFEVDNRLTLRLALTGQAYEEPGSRSLLLEDLLDRVNGLPGVEAAAAVNGLPISQSGIPSVAIEVEGQGWEEEGTRVSYQTVSRNYFETLSIPLQSGRLFSQEEVRRGKDVALLSDSLAEILWPGQEPVGRRVRLDGSDMWLEVVGTVGDVEPGERIAGVGSQPTHQLYVPLARGLVSTSRVTATPTLVLSTLSEPTVLAGSVRQELRRLAPGVPMFDVLTMDEVLNRFYFAQRLWSQMFSVIAGLALLIAGVGAYGVTAYSMSQRTREMGIRIALGAHQGNLLTYVVYQGLLLTAVGIGVGLLGAVPLAHTMRSLLHGMGPLDPSVFAFVVVLLLTVGWLASYLPARRVSSLDPITALRAE